jgi:two-component system, NarL family, sensor kinase
MRMRLFFALVLLAAGCSRQTPVVPGDISNRWYNRITSDTKPAVDSLLIYAQMLDSVADGRAQVKAMATFGYGIYYKQKGYYRQAYSSFMNADSLASKTGTDTLRVRALIGAGQCDWSEGRTDNAIEKMLRALKLAEKTGFKRGIAGAHISLAQVYQQSDKTDLAREHLRAAMRMSSNYGSDRNYFIAAHTLANLYGMRGKIDSALAIDSAMLLKLNSDSLQKFRSMFYDNQANCYTETRQFDKAYAAFMRSIAQDSLTGDARQQADTYLGLSNLFLAQNNVAQAEGYLNEFLRRARSINYRQGEKQAWQILAGVYAGQGKYTEALAAKDSVRRVSERLLNEKTQTRIAELQTVYDTEKKDRLLAQASASLSRQRLITGAVAVVALLLLLLGLAYYRRYRHRKNEELRHELRRQQQLATQALFAGEQQERLRIGRDLHDGIGQQLAALKMQLSGQNLSAASVQLVEQTLNDVRAISHNLIPEALNFGLAAALDELSVQLSHSGTTATFNPAPGLPRPLLNPEAELSVFRLVQEVTGNMLKYAQATHITINLHKTEQGISLLVADNGRGFDTKQFAQSSGRGWGNVQARALMLGGTVTIDSAPDSGTKLYLHIPVNPGV